MATLCRTTWYPLFVGTAEYMLILNKLVWPCTTGQLMVLILHDRTIYGSSFDVGAF